MAPNDTIIGVMPQGFSFPWKGTDLWLPMAFTAEMLASRGNHYLLVVARLRQGVSLSQANADLRVLLTNLSRQYRAPMALSKASSRSLCATFTHKA